jgi:hypothetical protein
MTSSQRHRRPDVLRYVRRRVRFLFRGFHLGLGTQPCAIAAQLLEAAPNCAKVVGRTNASVHAHLL